MANNLFADVPAAIVAKQTIDFAAAGFDSTNTRIIYEVGSPLKSWVPGRAINAVTGFTSDKGYYIVPKLDMDKTAYVAPPLPTGSLTTLNAPTGVTLGTATTTTQPITWSDTNSSPNEVSYQIQFRAAGVGSFVNATVTGLSATGGTVTGLTAGTNYDYRVIAKGDGSTTADSAASSTVTGSTASGSDADVTAFAATLAADTNPFTLSGARLSRMNTLITTLKAATTGTLYPKLYDFGFLHLGTQPDSRQHGFKGVVNPVYVSGFTFSDSGSLPNGSTDRIDLGISPNALPQDSGAYGVVTSSDNTDIALPYDGMMGVDGSAGCSKLMHSNGGNIYAEFNSADAANPTAHTAVKGLYSVIRPDAATEKIRINGATFASRSIASTGKATGQFGLGMVRSIGGGIGYHSNRNLLFWYLADSALTDAEETALKDALKTYLDAEGITAIP